MSEQFFLLAVARTLRDTIAPLLEEGQGRFALLACERILLRLAYPLKPIDGEADLPLPLDRLPPALKDALAAASAPQSFEDGDLPPESMAIRPGRSASLGVAARWTGTADVTGEDRAAVAALVDWEGILLDSAENTLASLERPAVAKEDDLSLDLDPATVEAYLRGRSKSGDALRLTAFTQLAGGRSKQTALVSLTGAKDLPSELVIRRDHPAPTMTRSVVQEYPLLRIVHAAGVAVPEPLFLETSSEPLGKPFAALARLPGRSHGTHFAIPDEPSLALALAEQLAKLHAIPVREVTSVFENAPEWDDPARRADQLGQIESAWSRFARTPSVTMSAAFRWLEANLDCVEGAMSVVHSDVGFHNILTDGARLVALLDWETAHVGNPAQDLGYARPIIERMVPWATFIERYRAAGGRSVTERQIDFFGIWETIRVNAQLRHARMLFESGATDDIMLGEVGTYYVPRFLHRVSGHLRRAMHAL